MQGQSYLVKNFLKQWEAMNKTFQAVKDDFNNPLGLSPVVCPRPYWIRFKMNFVTTKVLHYLFRKMFLSCWFQDKIIAYEMII